MRGRSRPIGLIGRVDPSCTMVDGQTVKTRTLYRFLVDRYGAQQVRLVDTYDYRHRAPIILVRLLGCLATCDRVVVLLSSNGRRLLFPALSLAVRLKGMRVFHNLIGGRLADDVEQDASGRLARQLRSFEVNWVESRVLVERLRALGVANTVYLPNCKDLSVREPRSAPLRSPMRMCTFSRVTAEKGISNAVRTVAALNAQAGRRLIELDIYGPIEPSYEAELRSLLAEAPEARYAGLVQAERSVETIRDYDALLFPTEWQGEGMPGTIIDALFAGLPVVSSRWPFHDEMLEDGVTGVAYDFDRPEDLADALRRFLALSHQEVEAMRRACVQRAGRYTPETVFGRLAGALEGPRP